MDYLLSNYERELGLLRRSMAIFAARHPTMAARLGIVGDHSEDVHIERLLQSFALLAANLDNRLEYRYPEFTDALLGMVYPQYLRPLPACAIIRFDIADTFDKTSKPATTPRGTEISSKTTGYRFRTVHDVTLSPVRISNARYTPTTSTIPSGVVLPAGTTGILSITFAVIRPDFRIEDIAGPLRIYVDGQSEIVSTTMDAMMLNTVGSFVENATGRWTQLNASPLAAVGYDDTEKLIDEDTSQPALRLLTEYFAFPKKFDFVDLDFKALTRAAGSGQHMTLHLAIRRVHPDSWPAQRLKHLSAENIQLHCTPVVNLFRLASLQLKRDPVKGAYPVQMPKTVVAGSEIWSVNAVHVTTGRTRKMAIHPFTSLMHGSSEKLTGPYWILMQAEKNAGSGKTETAIGLVGLDGNWSCFPRIRGWKFSGVYRGPVRRRLFEGVFFRLLYSRRWR
ncbi:type VI secretion system baseplate subunit TssF [Paraburkholderia sp. A3BS-1L]|uniref:type VI secretion system baseplate subunit TssF n=1 Tax=Paraburkholderia sp. A3BS-1L TaxID=3028375 RepID=UPI003DA87D14